MFIKRDSFLLFYSFWSPTKPKALTSWGFSIVLWLPFLSEVQFYSFNLYQAEQFVVNLSADSNLYPGWQLQSSLVLPQHLQCRLMPMVTAQSSSQTLSATFMGKFCSSIYVCCAVVGLKGYLALQLLYWFYMGSHRLNCCVYGMVYHNTLRHTLGVTRSSTDTVCCL